QLGARSFRRGRLGRIGGSARPAEQRVELGLSPLGRALRPARVGIRSRPAIIAEVRAFLVPDFLGGRLAAVLGNGRAVPLAQLTDVQLRSALLAFVEPP